MTAPLRVLITGFGPFPGAPYNPTPALVGRLLRLRRPAFSNVERIGHIFPVSYRAVDDQLPQLLARHRPDALLMFGLAARTNYVRVETRARNAITTLWPDAEHARVRTARIAGDADAQSFGPHTARLLQAAQTSGIDARTSRNAGSYLCNYLSWRAIEATNWPNGPRLAAFIHVPLLPRDGAMQRRVHGGITADQLALAGEAMLLEMVRLTRHARREAITAV
jgi:pyroglutamyl-peptidase